MRGTMTRKTKWKIVGTDVECVLTNITAAEWVEIMGSPFASFFGASRAEPTIEDTIASQKVSADVVARHCFDGDGKTLFENGVDVLNNLSIGQIAAAVSVIVTLSGLAKEDSSLAEHFRGDGGGEVAGAHAASNGEGVRGQAV